MDEEVREAHREAFDTIILVLSLIGLAGSVIALLLDGPASLWFLRSVALLTVVLIAFVLRRAGQFVVAAYVLVLELIGLVAGAFLQSDVFTSFMPYLFIPIIIIASLILSPQGTIIAALFSIGLTLLIVAVTGQLTPANLLALLPPFSLLLLTSLLAALGGRYIIKADTRLAESKKLLRERTLDLLTAMEDSQQLQNQMESLKQELLRTKSETRHAHQVATYRDQRLSGLVEGVIQELKTSIVKMEQAVEALAQVPQAGAQNNLLPEAWRQIDHLTGLVISLEEMVKLEQPEVQLELQPVDLAQLLSETVQIAASLASDKQLDLRCKPSANLPPVPADPARLRQALLQLLSNAIKYTDQGVIEVQTELTGAEVTILISDTGIGMSNEELKAIFQNFSRGQSAPAKQRPGAGLGLPLSKRIVELHGGRLWATSVLGVGSTFCLALPLEADIEKTQLSLPALASSIRETQMAAPTPLGRNEPVQPASKPVFKTSSQTTPEPVSSQTQVNFGPVARFSPVYISRFGATLLILLLLITSLVLALALINSLTPSQAQIAQTTPVSVTKNAVAPKTPSPTYTMMPSPSATPTRVQPTATATFLPTTRSLAQPASSQEPLFTSTPTTKPTNTPTATPSPTLPPTATPTATVTPSPTVTPEPVSLAVAPAAEPASRPTTPFAADLQNYPALAGLGFAPAPGSNLTVTTNPAASSGLSWLPTASGYQALFSGDLVGGDRDLYLAPTGDGQPVNLTHSAGDDLQPAVSPDGRRIAFSSGRGGNLDIYVMDSDGGNVTQLTSSRGFDEWPAWSPDGRSLAFVSDRDGNVELYLVPAGGGQEQRLTNHPADDWPAIWSPDGRSLLFASNRDGNWNLYSLELERGNLTRLTNDPGDEHQPVWSPDGRTIAFAYYNGSNWNIYTLPAPTGAPIEIPRSQWTQVTTSSRDERHPTWLP